MKITKTTEVNFMSKGKNKVRKLADEQYNEYIAVLRNDASLYMADGRQFVPDEIAPEKRKEIKKGD